MKWGIVKSGQSKVRTIVLKPSGLLQKLGQTNLNVSNLYKQNTEYFYNSTPYNILMTNKTKRDIPSPMDAIDIVYDGINGMFFGIIPKKKSK